MRYGMSWPGYGRTRHWVSAGPVGWGMFGGFYLIFVLPVIGLIWLYAWCIVFGFWLLALAVWLVLSLIQMTVLALRGEHFTVTPGVISYHHDMPPLLGFHVKQDAVR